VDGAAVRAASLGIDLPGHGTRRGGSERPPEELFFNFLNPRAARDNVAQGAADLMALVRWARNYFLPGTNSPTGRTISFDADRIALFGHSQGALHTVLMLPYEPDVAAAVLSGNGAYLTESLLNKTKPFDIAGALPFALLDANSDRELDGGSFHPVLAIFQMYFERVDGINFAYRLQTEPEASAPTGHHVFMTYGLYDSYSPEPTQKAYARAADLPTVGEDLANLGQTRAEPPLGANADLGGVARTIGLRQYTPSSGEDGHFVAFDAVKGRPDVLRFLLQALSGQTPEIGQ
jgi:pimeloyl-ACP methyl ester carboxylesterase